MKPTLEATDEPGLAFHDPIESTQFELLTDRPVSPTPADAERLYFPVDRAVTIRTGELVVPKLVHVTVRTPEGDHLTDFDPEGSTLVEHGRRLLDISTTPMPLYLLAPGPTTLRRGEDAVRIEFDGPVEVVVGCRSVHERPAATITVPPEPEPVMAALSAFGSALKTTSCERSYPTLRGHPPRLELGAALDVPAVLEGPSTGVTVELPPSFEHVMPAAPLAYYLGAEVRPGPEPALRFDGRRYPLEGPGGYETALHRTLQQVFFLDSVVRTEGLYKVPLAERRRLEARLDGVDPEALYGAELPEQLSAYLSVEYEAVADLLPAWPLCVDVAPDPEYVPALPYLVNDLALVRCTGPPEPDPGESPAEENEYTKAVDEFVRSDGGTAEERTVTSLQRTFRLPAAPAIEHAYLGPGLPMRVNKCSVESLRRRLNRTPAAEPGISVRIVCNDEAMADEGVVEEYYGLRDLVQFDVTVDYGLSVRDLRGVLASDVDFLHYIGHIDHEGIECVDGKLDARDLGAVDVDAFLLNACTSYEQGQALIDAGAAGGVVTTAIVSNTTATAIGRTLARTLNAGFTLRSALSIADDHHPTAYRYLVLGDGGLQLVQADSGIPKQLDLEPLHDGEADYRIDLHAYPTEFGPGPWFTLYLDIAGYYLPFGHVDSFSVSKQELLEFLDLEVKPVTVNDRLFWSDELTAERLP